MDLMYGLPHQTLDRVRDMVEKAATLKPHRVAVFGYAHVPWMKSHQKMIKEEDLPDGPERWRQFELISELLVENGYVKLGLDHFALPDDDMAAALKDNRLHRNFQGYTVDEAPVMLGFGASAIGSLPQGYVQNLSPLKDYRTSIDGGTPPIARGFALSDDDRTRRAIIERLMCDLNVDLDAFAGGTAAFAAELEKLAPLVDDGMVTIDGGHITVTEAGRPLIRLAASAFDSYLSQGKARHSRAV
jgi:oxygen-independent coproporphyrinogen-3 oxidase